jgi:hypothetical protein
MTPWISDKPIARPLPNKHRINVHKHPCLSRIRTYDPGLRAGEDNSCLRPLSYRDRLMLKIHELKLVLNFIAEVDVVTK